MIALRPLFVLTGAVQVHGGKSHRQEKQSEVAGPDGASFAVVQRRTVTDERRAADVIATDYSRRVRRLRLLKTPFGALVTPEALPTVKKLIGDATRDAAAFNAEASEACQVANCMLWEPLRGNRLAAVAGWISRRLDAKDPDVVAVADKLVADGGAA